MAPTARRCRHGGRRHQADAQWLVAVAAQSAVEVALLLGWRLSPVSGRSPAIEAAWLAARIVAGELIARAVARRLR
ncbi:MAG TPA: hypothetical protein VKV21_14090 [Solirubrobacteraceae bacterium]|nr:hypothetical protein [Solirubrobacteraceae bacterium]